MSVSPVCEPPGMTPAERRFEAISEELAVLCGQQNAIAGQIVELLVCPFHHRLHHRGRIRIVRRDGAVTVLDRRRRPLSAGALARPPGHDLPPAARYEHPTGERFDMRWYEPPSLS